jgi:hypothetical protein
MNILSVVTFAVLATSQSNAPCPDFENGELQHFLAQGWGFEIDRSTDSPRVRAVYARKVEEARARQFLASFHALDRLAIESPAFAPGDIRSLARQCPTVCSIDLGGSWYRGPPTLEAALWPELFEFNGLRHLAIQNLRCSGDEKWSSPGNAALETLTVSGNLSGMLPSLLAFCKVRCLRLELLASKQELTAADHAALNSQSDMESLEILGDVFGDGIFVDLNALSQLKKLRKLSLRQCRVDPVHLHHFPMLNALTLQNCRFINHDFDALLTHPRLEELVLWDCTNEGLGITSLDGKRAKRLRAITLRFPVFAEINAFHSFACNYHLQLGSGGVCGVNDKLHSIGYLGPDEVGSLEKLQQLRSVSLVGGARTEVKISATAIAQLVRLDTLRRLEIVDTQLLARPRTRMSEGQSTLVELRLQHVTPLTREFVERLIGTSARTVFVGPFSGEPQDRGPDCSGTVLDVKEVRFEDITLPVASSALEARLLAPSVENVVLALCNVNKGAIHQLVRRTPSLRRLTFVGCTIQDEQELLELNDLDLKWIVFTETTVSAGTVKAMRAETVRFGSGWRGSRTSPEVPHAECRGTGR